jgi:peptidoglycan/xylan/chitin deacetylase (PgdA/CDA1 family)
VLARYAVKATFFLVGAQIAGRERTVELLAQAGHTVGNHSWDHPDLRALSLHEVRSQLTATSDAIEAVTGARPTLFRPPYGYTSTPIDALARGLGMRTIMWDLDTRDWDLPGAPAIAESILTAPPGAVILLHDGPKARRETVAAVEIALAAKGCSQSIA